MPVTTHPLITSAMIEKAARAVHGDIEAGLRVHTRRQDRWEDLSLPAKVAIGRRAVVAINAVIEDILEAAGRSPR